MVGGDVAAESAIHLVRNSFVVQHGGTLSASYRVKGGAKFVLRLPAMAK